MFRAVCISTLLAISGPVSADTDDTAKGEALYLEHCAGCHKKDGTGYVTAIPPLADSDYIASDVRRLLAVTVDGLSGAVTVNGVRYEGVMPPQNQLSDEELATVLNYVALKWANSAREFTAQAVAAYRSGASRKKPSTKVATGRMSQPAFGRAWLARNNFSKLSRSTHEQDF